MAVEWQSLPWYMWMKSLSGRVRLSELHHNETLQGQSGIGPFPPSHWRIQPKLKLSLLCRVHAGPRTQIRRNGGRPFSGPPVSSFLFTTFVSRHLSPKYLIRSSTNALNGLLWFMFPTVADKCSHVDRNTVAAAVRATTWSRTVEETHVACFQQVRCPFADLLLVFSL